MREEVVRLEDDPDPAAHRVDVGAPRDLLAAEEDAAGVDPLEQVDAAEQCRLARSRCADESHDFVLGNGQVDAPQHLVTAEGLRQPLRP